MGHISLYNQIRNRLADLETTRAGESGSAENDAFQAVVDTVEAVIIACDTPRNVSPATRETITTVRELFWAWKTVVDDMDFISYWFESSFYLKDAVTALLTAILDHPQQPKVTGLDLDDLTWKSITTLSLRSQACIYAQSGYWVDPATAPNPEDVLYCDTGAESNTTAIVVRFPDRVEQTYVPTHSGWYGGERNLRRVSADK